MTGQGDVSGKGAPGQLGLELFASSSACFRRQLDGEFRAGTHGGYAKFQSLQFFFRQNLVRENRIDAQSPFAGNAYTNGGFLLKFFAKSSREFVKNIGSVIISVPQGSQGETRKDFLA